MGVDAHRAVRLRLFGFRKALRRCTGHAKGTPRQSIKADLDNLFGVMPRIAEDVGIVFRALAGAVSSQMDQCFQAEVVNPTRLRTKQHGHGHASACSLHESERLMMAAAEWASSEDFVAQSSTDR